LAELAALWMRTADSTPADLDHAEMLAAAGRDDLAIQLCEAIQPGLPTELWPRLCATYFPAVVRRLGRDPREVDLAERAEEIARTTLARHGAFGAAVHFLFDRRLAGQPPLGESRDPARTQELLALLDCHLDF